MSQNRSPFTPDWIDSPPPARSYRAIFKWGAPDRVKHPSRGFYQAVKDALSMTDADFSRKITTGEEKVSREIPPRISADDLKTLVDIVGQENVSTDTFSRLKYSSGKAMEDILKLR